MSVYAYNDVPGELTIRAPQAEIDRLVANCRCDGINIQSSVSNDRPQPLPVFDWDEFYAETEPQQASGGTGESSGNGTAMVTNNPEGGDKPSPMPVYNWDDAYATTSGLDDGGR